MRLIIAKEAERCGRLVGGMARTVRNARAAAWPPRRHMRVRTRLRMLLVYD